MCCIGNLEAFKKKKEYPNKHQTYNGLHNIIHEQVKRIDKHMDKSSQEHLLNHFLEQEANNKMDNMRNPNGQEQNALVVISDELKALKNVLMRMEYKFDEKRKKEMEIAFIKKEWKAIAMILDRFFFVIYLVAISLSIIYMFPRPT